jgi:hypothetical protein
MRRGIVVATHPEDHSVDLVMSDGRRLVGVQVMSNSASARTGTVDLPAVPEKKNKWDITKPDGQDMVALVEFAGDVPVVVGFLFPQINQMTFADPKMRFSRHQSDVATSIDGDGNIQVVHPSGTYIRIGESPDVVDYAGKNFDESLATDRNTDKQVNIRIGMAGGVMTLTMAPDGKVTLETESTVDVKAEQINFDTPLLAVTGQIVAQGDVIGQNVSLATHVHPGVMFGYSSTLPPTPTGGGDSGGDTGGGDVGGGGVEPPSGP